MDAINCINQFLVNTFQVLLTQEEVALTTRSYQDLSVSEFHVIEAVCDAGADNSMSTLSKTLGITTGSLTVAVKTLEKEGYLQRERSPADRRRVEVLPTQAGWQANRFHRQFHRQMVETIAKILDPQQMEALGAAMRILTEFFAQGNHQVVPDA